MNVREAGLGEVLIIEPCVFEDPRGFFLETWNQSRYIQAGLPSRFVQDNLSYSTKGTLRGLHYQNPHPQGKLIYVLEGEVFDVVVDIRCGSPTYRKWIGVTLTAESKRQVYVPPGFAHGFCVMSDATLFAYKSTEFYDPVADHGITWDDPDIGINWPIGTPILSDRDRMLPTLKGTPAHKLPRFEKPDNNLDGR